MPAVVIPNKLSFIWVGPNLPERYGANILAWAEANPMYDVYLWTEAFNVHSNAALITDAYLHSVDSEPDSAVSIYDTFDGVMVSITLRGRTPLQIFVHSIGALKPLLDPSLLVEELTAWKNYGTASDILRFWIVNHIGGIYMDLDTYMDGNKPLPMNIHAPNGILFAEAPEGTRRTLITPIVASVADSPMLQVISSCMENTYDQEYPVVGHGVREFEENNKRRLHTLIEARKSSERELATTGKLSMDTDLTIFLMLVSPTLIRGGGWFSEIESRELTDSIVDEYSFQTQAGYKAVVSHDATWCR